MFQTQVKAGTKTPRQKQTDTEKRKKKLKYQNIVKEAVSKRDKAGEQHLKAGWILDRGMNFSLL